MSSILIKNGTVYDPVLNSMRKGDVAVNDGRIAGEASADAYVVDATGCIVTTGLIDYHLHVFRKGTESGVHADVACLPGGVTTCMDGGSAGCGNFTSFYENEIVTSTVGLRAMLNVASAGLIGGAVENIRPESIECGRIKTLFQKYPVLKALKLRGSKGVMDEEGAALKLTVSLADEIGCNVVVHVTDPAMPLEKIVSMLRPGDVCCHVYQGYGDTALNEDGMVKAGLLRARERGVIFDACNGRSNFAIEVAGQCIKEGFLPDIISSDLNACCYYMRPCVSLTSVMSKYLAFGMKLEDILRCVTLNPARALGEADELASLAPGTVGDICILRVDDCHKPVSDCHGTELMLDQMINPQMTIKAGEIVYCQNSFA